MDGGRVSVGVISTAKCFAPFALAAFQRRYPKIELRMRVANRRGTVAALGAFELDRAIMGYPPESFPLERLVIGDHPHVIIAGPDHALVGRAGIALGDIASQTFLLREPGSRTRDLVTRLFGGSAPASGPRIKIGSNETIKQAMMVGMGLRCSRPIPSRPRLPWPPRDPRCRGATGGAAMVRRAAQREATAAGGRRAVGTPGAAWRRVPAAPRPQAALITRRAAAVPGSR